MPEPTPARAPADRCDDAAGRLRPVIDRNRCEAKADCVTACPYDVFEIHQLSTDERRAQSWLGWLKTLAHGGKQAFAVRAAECHACGLCVEACPEKAIKLARAT
jgi:NAD-dependent dihydropyrimidine dehydrogenase PreA subunit